MRQQMKPDTGNCGENGQLPHEQKTCRLPPDDFGGMDETRTRDLLRDRQAF